jgi:hypothetical protein
MDIVSKLFSIAVLVIGAGLLWPVVQSYLRDLKDMKEEDADWAELDRMFEELKTAGKWDPHGSSPEIDAFLDYTKFIYKKWMSRHRAVLGYFDYPASCTK